MSDSLCHCRHSDGTDTPADHHGREKQARSYSSQPEVTRKLTDQISDVESRGTGAPDGITHTEVVLEASKTGIGHIDTIEVARSVLAMLPVNKRCCRTYLSKNMMVIVGIMRQSILRRTRLFSAAICSSSRSHSVVNRAWIAAGEVFSVVCMTTSIFSIDALSDFSVDILRIVLEMIFGRRRLKL